MTKLLYIVSFISGANLLAFELLSAKLLAPYFGTSYHVWSITFFVTLLGIALGYYFAHRIILKNNYSKNLTLKVLLINTVFLFALPFFCDFFLDFLLR
jgi:uncharacterized membrane protein YjjP (DUF1212 family)